MKDLKDKKILLTGGHAATTALSVVMEIQDRYGEKSPKIYWVGPKYAMEGSKVPTLASIILPKKGVEFVPIIAGRLLRKFNKWTIISLMKFPIGFIHAFLIVITKRPDLILSFGGYAAFPVVVLGYLTGVKVIIHDETYHFNSTNRLSAIFAKKICVSRKSSCKYYDSRKTQIIGNPMLKSISSVAIKEKLGRNIHIYITGGSSGSRSINDAIEEILYFLLSKYKVIHQTGRLDHKKFISIQNSLPKDLKNNYQVYDSISPFKVHKIFERSDIIISRAGANTVSEIILTKRPAILIPLAIGKWSEQEYNADYAKNFGVAKVIQQTELSGIRLKKEIICLEKDWDNIVAKIKDKESPDKDADIRLVNIIENYIS
ncbi:glycosyltransferase [Candidatus Woesebacteria bacterium]|nr:glycosyltransferase [Candidatus Woesebacteria bacterium]